MKPRLPLLFMILAAAGLAGEALAKISPLPTGKRNNAAPIEITSDTLEVLQQQNQAVFSGHVVVIQGDARLQANKMTVYYRKQEGEKQASTEPGAIRRIDATGDVFLSTREETASGATGTYDVEKQEIRLVDRVVLTRGKNVLKGDKLTYNLATGKSAVTAGASASGKKERVRAVFVPEKDNLPKARP